MKMQNAKCEGCAAEVSFDVKSPVCDSCWKLLPKAIRTQFLVARESYYSNKSRLASRIERKRGQLQLSIQSIALFLGNKPAIPESE